MRKVLIITGDGGESYETLYAVHRLREERYEAVVAAPTKRRLHLVMHDFEPGWDTYIEKPGYGLSSDITIAEARAADFDAILIMGGRAPEYLRNDKNLLSLTQDFARLGKWVFSICHGIQILAAADLLGGKRVTCYEQSAGKSKPSEAPGARNKPSAMAISSPRRPGIAPGSSTAN